MPEGLRLLGFQTQQGGRHAYMTTVKMSDLPRLFPVDLDPSDAGLEEQRILDPQHARAFCDYLLGSEKPIVPPVVLLIDRAASFEALTDGEGRKLRTGWITIGTGAKVTYLDGQHRCAGISLAREKDASGTLTQSEIAVWIVLEASDEGRRELFATVNYTPKPVPKSLYARFNTVDPYAVALNKELIPHHPLLKNLVEQRKTRVPPKAPLLYTTAALRDALMRLVGPQFPGQSPSVEQVTELGRSFLDALLTSRPELQKAVADPSTIPALRETSILVSSTTLRMLASAVAIALQNGSGWKRVEGELPLLDFDPRAKLWRETGFVAETDRTPTARKQEFTRASRKVADLISPGSGKVDRRTRASRGRAMKPVAVSARERDH
ncbi:DNA sulfur modification protein DndB [Geodermatophilus sp. SYSU D01180]